MLLRMKWNFIDDGVVGVKRMFGQTMDIVGCDEIRTD